MINGVEDHGGISRNLNESNSHELALSAANKSTKALAVGRW